MFSSNSEIRLSALDIGSNSFHLIVVSITPPDQFNIIAREREVLRLARVNGKIIHHDSISNAVEVVKRLKRVAESHNAPLHAVATSAVRESVNKDEFIKTILNLTGVKVKVINGEEEARLVYLGISKAISVNEKKTLFIDIGGGSTEFIIGNNGKIELVNSLELGAVRLSQKFFPEFLLSVDRISQAKKYVENIILSVKGVISGTNIELFVGSSGTIFNVGMMIKYMRNNGRGDTYGLNGFEFYAEELYKIEKNVLSKKNKNIRKFIPGLEERRADIIPAGIIILSTIFRSLKIEKMAVSEYSLKEGVILDALTTPNNIV